MRLHKEGFCALDHSRFEDLTCSYKSIDQELIEQLVTLRQFPSNELVEEIISMGQFTSLLNQITNTTGTESEMTLTYLRDVSTMLEIVSAVREGNLQQHLQAEREMLKLVFAFDHIHYARYNTYQHIFLQYLERSNNPAYTDLCIQGYGASSIGDPFSTIHGDLVTEHLNRENKGTAGPFRSGYSTNLSAVNMYIVTFV